MEFTTLGLFGVFLGMALACEINAIRVAIKMSKYDEARVWENSAIFIMIVDIFFVLLLR